tara:strand:- start:1244 stop:1870 length:627 start_codon:yes stop_codon:yes gene_type:complete
MQQENTQNPENIIILATNNLGKVKELEESLAQHTHCSYIAQSEFAVPEVEETGLTFVENALIKARNACSHSGLPSLADDSGLIVPALNDQPGIYSARYAGNARSFDDNINKLLNELDHTAEEDRYAYFVCNIVYLRSAEDPIPLIFQGMWEGRITNEPKGDKGFGYDPVFFVPEHNCTAAELDLNIKNQISHRAQAIDSFKNFLQEDF